MHISAKAEYACVALLELAASYRASQPLRIKTIAEAHGISERFLVQILLQLKAAGIVNSVRGAAGGYQLAKPPARITLGDVINAIGERTLTMHSALDNARRSPFVDALREVWKDVQVEEQRLLEKYTVADLLSRSQRGSAPSYQI